MRRAALEVTFVVTASFLGGCASTPGVRQAKQTDPIIVVTVQSTPKKVTDKPVASKQVENERRDKEAELAGILGTLEAADIGVLNGVPGGVPGGVIGGVSGGGFGAFGSGGIGVGGIGTGTGGLGSIGTLGTGSGYGSGWGGLGIRGSSGGGSERVKVRLGNVSVSGPLMVDVVQRHIDDRRNDIQDCHDFERSRSGNRWGSLTLRLHIDPAGRVDEVRLVESSVSSSELESCIAHVVGAFEFPPPGTNGSVSVTLPISF